MPLSMKGSNGVSIPETGFLLIDEWPAFVPRLRDYGAALHFLCRAKPLRKWVVGATGVEPATQDTQDFDKQGTCENRPETCTRICTQDFDFEDLKIAWEGLGRDQKKVVAELVKGLSRCKRPTAQRDSFSNLRTKESTTGEQGRAQAKPSNTLSYSRKIEKAGGAEGRSSSVIADTLELRPYYGAEWFTERGVRAKRKLLEKRGIPDLKYWKMITLTVPEGVDSPRNLFEKGKRKLPRFRKRIEEAISRKFPWAWKLEIQENENPHWHFLVGIKERIPEDFLDVFEMAWGLGRVNVKAVTSDDFKYLFKYVSKSPCSSNPSDCEIDLPSWVLDYRKTEASGRVTAGIRFWQTGGGFYTNTIPKKETERKVQKSSRVPYIIRQRWEIWMRKAVMVARKGDQIVGSKQVAPSPP